MKASGANEVRKLMDRWVAKTTAIMKEEMQKKGIGITDDLAKSLSSEVTALADGYIQGEFSFLVRGRFVDMGAGNGYKNALSRDSGSIKRGRKLRKPKKWYSRVFYGRLSDLRGAVGYKIMEEAIGAVTKPLKNA